MTKPPQKMTKSTNRLKPLLRLWPWLWRYKRVLLAASVALLFAAAATLSLPVALRYLIDAGFSAQHSARIDAAFLAMFGVAAVMAVALVVATAMRWCTAMLRGVVRCGVVWFGDPDVLRLLR